jgi:gamma-glutamyltranspeptidase/glutathione hydrolase
MFRFETPRRLAVFAILLVAAAASAGPSALQAQRTQKPVLHAKHWMAITGKPLGATAGAMIFTQGGNAIDAAAAMLGVNATMWDTKGWGGETQALIYNPNTGKVIGINALGVAPARATAEHYKSEGYEFPPRYGPLAAVTPGTPGGLMTMLAEWGTMSLEEVLAPSIEMAMGYPIEAQAANGMEGQKERIKEWKYSREVFLPHLGSEDREAPYPGEIFVQEDLARTLMKLVEAEREALAAGKSREEAIYAAYDRFYRGDVGQEFVRGANEEGGLFEMSDLENWEVKIEEPVMTTYKGIEVYKLTHWVQGPMMLQTLNILETLDLNSMGFNSARYSHALYQAMNMAFADRDFYYGDPYFPPEEPIAGLLSKEYARDRAAQIDWEGNDPDVRPGDPYPYQGGTNPFLEYLENWHTVKPAPETPITDGASGVQANSEFATSGATTPDLVQYEADFYAGTTSIQAADKDGWVVSITPSGGWIPAVIAGETGMGMSQRAQSFVTDPADNPYNVIEPGKRPRATLTPTLALKEGKPYLSFAVQGGDSQEQNLVQFFLNMVEWDMTVQQAVEAPNMNSYQLRGSFGNHESEPGRMLLQEDTPPWIRAELRRMGYDLTFSERTSGPINAIFFDWENGSMWGGSSQHGEDYGIGW